MSRLIDADKLYEKFSDFEAQAFDEVGKLTPEKDEIEWHRWNAILAERTAFKHDVADAPTVEAEPIRHGHWEDKYGDGDWHCSVCGAIVEKDEQNRHNWNRCYHCGAKMDGNER